MVEYLPRIHKDIGETCQHHKTKAKVVTSSLHSQAALHSAITTNTHHNKEAPERLTSLLKGTQPLSLRARARVCTFRLRSQVLTLHPPLPLPAPGLSVHAH